MKYASCIIVAITFASTAHAQQVMDGSDHNLPPQTWSEAQGLILKNLRDPYSTQFDHMKVLSQNPPIICGRFNGKNSSGGYEGFRPFKYDSAEKRLTINETNECGEAFIDKSEIEKINQDCAENTRQIKLFTSGFQNGADPALLTAKGKWCQNWYQQQILIELQKSDGK